MGQALALVALVGCNVPAWLVPVERVDSGTLDSQVTETGLDEDTCHIDASSAVAVSGYEFNNEAGAFVAVCSTGELTNNGYGATLVVAQGGQVTNQAAGVTIYAQLGATVIDYAGDTTLVYGVGADIGDAERYLDVTECTALTIASPC